MIKIFGTVVGVLMASTVAAEVVMTTDGRMLELHNDGTYEFIEVEHNASSNWIVERSISDMTDFENVFIGIGDESQDSFMGMPMLIARCFENRTSMYVKFPGKMMVGNITADTLPGMIRIGSNEAYGVNFNKASGDLTVAFIPNAIETLRNFTKADIARVVIQVENNRATFDISGALDAIQEVATACSWNIQ